MRSIFSLACIASFALCAPVQSQTLVHWGDVPGWEIMVDPTLGNGCLIQSEFTDGSTVRIGLDAQEGNGYLTAFNENWGDIEEGAVYPVSFDLDGVIYHGEAEGIWLDDVPGADIVFDNVEFIVDIAAKRVLTLYHDGDEVMAIDLAGTAVGLEQVFICQDAQR
ncbi:MAG: hypothetical protein ACK4GW_00395 [Pseudorhodobacter sp.]